MNYSQANSVFMPGLTRRGPVFNSLGALPSLSPGMKWAIEIGLIAAGVYKKLPLPVAIAGAFAVYMLFPDDSSGAAAATPQQPVTTNLIVPDMSNTPIPLAPLPDLNLPLGDVAYYYNR